MSSQILHNNYLTERSFNSITASSEAVGYPLTNAYLEPRRKRFWRTTGNFYVPEGRSIIFQETTGVDLEATFTEASYATPALFAAAVKAALDLAGASTYTVSQNATSKRFTITSNGAGGGGVFVLKFASSPVLADLLGYSNTDLSGSLSYVGHAPRSMSRETVLLDFGGPVNPDAFVLTWSQDVRPSFTPNATIIVEGNPSNDFDSPVATYGSDFQVVIPYSDYGFVHYKSDDTAQGMAPTAYRFWRISIIDRENANGYVDVGHMFLGDGLGFSRGKIQFPFNMRYELSDSKTITYNGSVIAQKRYQARIYDTNWKALTQSEKDDLDLFFMDHGQSKPFYIMADKGTVLSGEKEKSIFYSRLNSEPSWTMEFPGFYSCDLSLREDI